MVVISLFSAGFLTVAITVFLLVAASRLRCRLERYFTVDREPLRELVNSAYGLLPGAVLFFALFYLLHTRIYRLLESLSGA